MAQINVPLDDDVKQQWEQYVEEHPDYRYVTHLVRAAVGKEIRGQSGGGNESNDVAERLSDIERVLLRVEDAVKETNDRIDAVESQLEAPSAETTELAGDVFEVLPKQGEDPVGNVSHNALTGDEVVAPDGRVLTGRVRDIADHLDADSIRVRQALQQLADDTPLVDSMTTGDEKRWFRAN